MKHCFRVDELLRSEASNEYREEDGVGVLFDDEQLYCDVCVGLLGSFVTIFLLP